MRYDAVDVSRSDKGMEDNGLFCYACTSHKVTNLPNEIEFSLFFSCLEKLFVLWRKLVQLYTPALSNIVNW